MAAPVSMLEFVRLLLSDHAERARFDADPDTSLAQHGLSPLSPADVHDAVLFVQDTLTVDWDQAYGTGAGESSTAVEEQTTSDSTWRWASDGPGHAPESTGEHPEPLDAHPDVVHEVLFDASDLHFGL